MDQSKSLQDQDEVWAAKLAMLGCTFDMFQSFYFIYVGGHLKICGQDFGSIAREVIDNLQKGLYS